MKPFKPKRAITSSKENFYKNYMLAYFHMVNLKSLWQFDMTNLMELLPFLT
jgi:hypothetical protein